MASLPIITDVHRVALNWIETTTGQRATNVIHVMPSPAAVKTPAAVFTCLDAHVTSFMFGPQTNSAFVNNVVITPLDGSSASQTFLTGNPAKWGGSGAGEWSPAVANIIKMTTSLRGRSNRGRIYLPFVREADQTNGLLTGTTASDVTTAWHTFQTAILADGTTPLEIVVASYKLATANAAFPVTCESVLATQRRRQSRLR